jgi:hypothetical protein
MKYFDFRGHIDVRELNAQLAEHPELWGQFGWRKNNSQGVHAQMDDIWVRYNDIRKYPEPTEAFNERHVPIWYPAWRKLPALRDIVFPLMTAVEGEMLGAVLITKIPPGAKILPHVDRGWHVEYYDKYYVSLQSQPGAEFWCGEEMINPKTGDCYRFDNRLEHWVNNDSDRDRITLIVCIRSDYYRRQHGA